MKRVLSIILTLSMVCGLFAAGGIVAEAKPSGPFVLKLPVVFHQTEARQVLDLMNQFRTGSDAWYWNASNTSKVKATGLKPLEYDYDLEKIAMQRAAETVVSFSHSRPNGSSCFSAYGSYYGVGENIAAGYRTANSVYMGWREDNDDYKGQGHRRNMLSRDLTSVGIACAEYEGTRYWVQAFRTPTQNRNVTEPLDQEAIVSVEIAASEVQQFELSCKEKALALTVGDKVPLPAVTLTLALTNSWYALQIPVQPAWTSDNTACSVDGDQVVAKEDGVCNLIGDVLGQKITIPVNVHQHVPETLPPVTPTCVSTGLSAGSRCRDCGEILEKQKVLPKIPHEITVKESKAGYRKTGKLERVCTICGLRKTVETPAVETIQLSVKKYIYNGKNHAPKVTISDAEGKVLKQNVDYTLTYPTERKNVGTYQIVIRFIGQYAGTKKVSYQIVPGQVEKVTAKPGAEKATLSWTPVKGATGYIVYYSLKKNSGYKSLGSTKKTKASMVNLVSGKAYYFCVRAVTTKDGKQWKGVASAPVRVVAK